MKIGKNDFKLYVLEFEVEIDTFFVSLQSTQNPLLVVIAGTVFTPKNMESDKKYYIDAFLTLQATSQ